MSDKLANTRPHFIVGAQKNTVRGKKWLLAIGDKGFLISGFPHREKGRTLGDVRELFPENETYLFSTQQDAPKEPGVEQLPCYMQSLRYWLLHDVQYHKLLFITHVRHCAAESERLRQEFVQKCGADSSCGCPW